MRLVLFLLLFLRLVFGGGVKLDEFFGHGRDYLFMCWDINHS